VETITASGIGTLSLLAVSTFHALRGYLLEACPAAPNLKSQKWLRALYRDPITLNRITVEILGWSMIFSESRLPLFGSCSRVLNGSD
jgi:hypothetical protein